MFKTFGRESCLLFDKLVVKWLDFDFARHVFIWLEHEVFEEEVNLVGIAVLGLLEELITFDVAQTLPRVEDVALARLLVPEFDLMHRGGRGLWLVDRVNFSSVADTALVSHF